MLGDGPVAVVRDADPLLDPKTIGRYEVLERLGEGGMGLIFAARDPELDRKVAVKLVRPALHGRGKDARSRLLREAQSLAKINHPNVIHVYEVGTYEDQVFVAMEFVDGKTLRDWQWQQHIGWRAILEVYIAAGRGLSAAHDRGMVHRDFKPDNVLVTADSKVRVIDFGLAQAARDRVPESSGPDLDVVEMVEAETIDIGRPMTRLTKTGAILGTPAYMAPEQHRGELTDARTDQFAFCVSLYEALYGMRPFAGKTYPVLVSNVLDGRVEDEPRFVEVPPFIRRALLRGLSPDPDRRYADLDALVDELRKDPRSRTRRNGIAAGVLALGAVGTGVWGSVDHARELRDERERLRDELDAGRIAALEASLGDSHAAVPNASWNDFVLKRARDSTGHDASLAMGMLGLLESPNENDIEAARLVAAQALSHGVRRSLPGAPDRAELLAVSSDRRFVVAASERELTVWEADRRQSVLASTAPITSVALGRAQRPILAGREDGSALLLLDGQTDLEIELHASAISAAAVSSDGERYATGDMEGQLVVWRLVDGEVTVDRRINAHGGPIRALAFDETGERLASGAIDGKLVRWKLDEQKHRDHEPGAMGIVDLAWARDGSIYYLASDGQLGTWLPDSDVTTRVGSNVAAFTLTPEGVLAVSEDGSLRVAPEAYSALRLDAKTSKLVSLGAERLLARDAEGKLASWTVRRARVEPVGGDWPGAWLVRVASDGQHFAAATHGGHVGVWKAGQPEPTAHLAALADDVLDIAFSPDSTVLAAFTDDGTLHLAPLDGSEPIARPGTNAPHGADLSWAPDSRSLAIYGCWDVCGPWVWTRDGTPHSKVKQSYAIDVPSLMFGPASRWLYVDWEGEHPFVFDIAEDLIEELEWNGELPPERIAHTWSDRGGLRVMGRDKEGHVGLWQRGPDTGVMHRVYEDAAATIIADAPRRHVLLQHADRPALLLDLYDDSMQPVHGLPEDLARFVVSPDQNWLLTQPADRIQAPSLVRHLPSSTDRELAHLFGNAEIGNQGLIVDADGSQIRVWQSPVPETWDVLERWIGAVTDVEAVAADLKPAR